MSERKELVAALKRQLDEVEKDLRVITEDEDNPWGRQLRDDYERARSVGRTALTWSQWRDGEVSLAGVAWVLAAVFVRFCEDNGLVDRPWISGPDGRLLEAADAEAEFYRQDPSRNTRDWLRAAFGQLAQFPATRGLVDPDHSPVWTAPLSADACADLLRFWRTQNPDGSLAWSLHDPDWDSRFLGDLYQDLSEFAKKKYALLQTPVFVEEFILDRTLTPALGQVPLAELKLIDPTCGSGHFLLGAFDRIHDAWLREAPAMDTRERVQKVLLAINGVDINPFAVAIARFRLTLVGLRACEVKRLADAPELKVRVAVADSLLAGRPKQLEMDFGDEDPDRLLAAHRYSAEDVDDYPGILERGRYHVVVGNPPYITVKDKALNEAYRRAYTTCKGKYALTVPFMELFFALAVKGDGHPAGWVGQITSNSFMKREFGSKVIELLLAGRDVSNPVDLTDVIDTSGAYIPGHGTPTVILIARRRSPQAHQVRAVLGVRGEPGQPEDPKRGLVWTEIVEHIADLSGFDGEYVTVTDVPRSTLTDHPWSLSGGSAAPLKAHVEEFASQVLGEVATALGIQSVTGEDSLYMLGDSSTATRLHVTERLMPLVEGESLRDYAVESAQQTVWPYGNDFGVLSLAALGAASRLLWAAQNVLNRRKRFGTLMLHRGLTWWEWQELYVDKLRTPLSIAYAEVATHNHFVLDRGGKVFKQTGPVIKLPAGASEDEHLALLGVLNSSVACFWLKQVSHNKGSTVDSSGARQTTVEWENFYQFNATKVKGFPLPGSLPLTHGRTLDTLAQSLQSHLPSAVCATGFPTRQRLDEAHLEYDRIRAEMIAWQEELDWHCYGRYDLIDDNPTTPEPPPIALGQRAFEIGLARKVAAGEEETAWFERHGSTPITEIPAHWPQAYRDLVQRRLDLIESDRSINLLERPEFKRRWATDSWDAMAKKALTEYLLDRLENPDVWLANGNPRPMTAAQIADAVRNDEGIQSALDLLFGANADRAKAIGTLMADEAVPYLAAYRYKPSGMVKRAEWEQVWDLQRREDAGETVDIPVPPKYAQADFRKSTYWKARGKLDVPKERFVSYPEAGRANDPTALYGWAGWDHGQQAQALGEIVVDRQDREGWDTGRVIPLVAGLVELEPWLHQWHADIDPEYGTSLAEEMTALIDQRLGACGITRDEARAWRPAEQPRGRRSAS